MNAILTYLRHVASRETKDAPDAELLRRFIRGRDEDAFAGLLQRHGPMVLGVCQRVLSRVEDAEDAFQATFLVFARKAASIADPALLGNWLYGVACRVALKAKAEAAQRRAKEARAMAVPSREPEDVLWSDLRPVLDAEVNRLPEKPRTAFVLCYLEGRTNEEAARLLGCPVGTVTSRLAAARERLRARLTRRGIALSAALLAAVLSRQPLSAAAPAGLAGKTATAALRVAGGCGITGVVSESVARLTKGVLHTMYLNHLLKGSGLLLLALTLLTGTGVSLFALRADEPEAPEALGGRRAKPPAPGDADRKEVTEVATVEDVWDAYQHNDALADEKFTDRRVRVRGAALQVRRSGQDGYVLTMATAEGRPMGAGGIGGGPPGLPGLPGPAQPGVGPLMPGGHPPGPTLVFEFPKAERPELAKLRPGQEVVIEGQCEGKVEGGQQAQQQVRFRNCKVVEIGKPGA